MFGYARNSGIHWLRNYGDALHKYESTTDIRGRKEEPKRPLGHRKSVDMYSIVKLDNGDIQCVLYKTPVVTFHTDSTVTIKDEGWASQTTANFIPEVMGGDVYARVFDTKLSLTVCGDEYFVPRDSGLKLSKTELGNWQVDNPPNNVIHHINRKESKLVLAKYEDFFSYLERMKKLRFDGERAVFSEEEYVQTFGALKDETSYVRKSDCVLNPNYDGANLIKFKEYITDTSEAQHMSYYKAMLILVNTVAWIGWDSLERKMKRIHWDKAVNELKNVIWGFHRDEVFKEVPVASGIVKRDTYDRFFRGGWNQHHKLTLLSTSETTQKNT
jgi:hypothetical protein